MILAFLSWLHVLLFQAALAAPPRNVILISIDTLSADHMSLYGYPRATTPFIDSLASEGVVFENALSQAGWTLPSHYSIFTGVYPETHRITVRNAGDGDPRGAIRLDPRYRTLTELLKARGYETHWFGVTNHRDLDLLRGLERGFDSKTDLELDNDPRTLKRLEAEFRRLSGKRKRFLFFHTYMVHDPYLSRVWDRSRPAYAALFDPSFSRRIEFDLGKVTARDRSVFADQFNLAKPADRIHFEALYDGGIRAMDDALRAVFALLKSSGLYEGSVIVITSDHGEAFGQHGEFFHGGVSREELHVPLLILAPGARPTRIHQQVRGIDIMPTVLDLVGEGAPENVEGRSLVPLLNGKALLRDSFTCATGSQASAIWDDEWKYAETADGMHFLYRISVDPAESDDVSSAHPAVVLRMKSALDAFKLTRVR